MTVDEAIAWAKKWSGTSNGLSEDSLAALVLANEVERLRKESTENAKDADRLNEMLRQTGYGQGSIDAYVAQCEELDELKEENRNLAASSIPPADFGELTLENGNHITLRCANKKDAAKMLRWLADMLKARINNIKKN